MFWQHELNKKKHPCFSSHEYRWLKKMPLHSRNQVIVFRMCLAIGYRRRWINDWTYCSRNDIFLDPSRDFYKGPDETEDTSGLLMKEI
jgi:hypothetical protein